MLQKKQNVSAFSSHLSVGTQRKAESRREHVQPAALRARVQLRRRPLPEWQPELFLSWLHFLVQQLLLQQQPVFWVEDLQPDWLSGSHQRLYRWSVKVIVGLVSVFFTELVIGLFFGLHSGQHLDLLSGLLVPGLPAALYVGLFCGLCFGREKSIRPAEVINWSFHVVPIPLRAFLGFVLGYIGLLIGLQELQAGSVSGESLLSGLLCLPLAGLLMGFRCAPFPLSASSLTRRTYHSPNEGIRRSAKHGLLIGLATMLSVTLLMGLIFLPMLFSNQAGIIVSNWLLLGLLLGLPASLSNGLVAFIQHGVLRFFLWRTNCLPWDLVPFLDQAAKRRLLRKVGGSYLLTHRLLRLYCDSLDEPIPPAIAALEDALTITSGPDVPVAGEPATITYDGCLGAAAETITMHWSSNNWNNISQTAMTKQRDGTWQATIVVPADATKLNMAFYDQSHRWDNHRTSNYLLTVSESVPAGHTGVWWSWFSRRHASRSLRKQVRAVAARLSNQSSLGSLKAKRSRKWHSGKMMVLLPFALMSGCVLWSSLNALSANDFSLTGLVAVAGFFYLFPLIMVCIWRDTFYRSRHSTDFLYEHGLVLVRCQGTRIVLSKAMRWRDITSILHTAVYDNESQTTSHRYLVYYRTGETVASTEDGEWASGQSLAEEIAHRSGQLISHAEMSVH